MKVADVMQKRVDSVTSDATVMDIARIIFGRGINGVPVLKDKKVVGFVTERDILAKFFPSMQDYIEDPLHASDFEGMEHKSTEILNLPVTELMTNTPVTVTADTPLLEAESRMTVRRVGRLPVVDNEGNLIGIISRGDIFKSAVGEKMPYAQDEEYHDWLAKHWDVATDWETRLKAEIPYLTSLFKKRKVEKILDVGCGTGEHAIALAQQGFQVVGIENSRLMFKSAREKWVNLPKPLQDKITFIRGDYVEVLKNLKSTYDGAIFMGNMLAHIPESFKDILKQINEVLDPKRGVIVAQLLNFEKSLQHNNRLVSFVISQSASDPKKEQGFLWFYNAPKGKKDHLVLNAAVLDYNGKFWSVRGTNSVETVPFSLSDIKKIFSNVGFNKITFYGMNEWDPMLKTPFKQQQHHWLSVVAIR